MKLFACILCFAALFSLSTQARADNTGDVLHPVLYDGPTVNGNFIDPGTTTSSPGVADIFNVRFYITPDTIILTQTSGNSYTDCSAGPGDVCGFRLEDLTKDPLYASLTLDPSSTFSFFTPSIEGDALIFDFTNHTFYAGQEAVFDVTYKPSMPPTSPPAATPEPGSLMLLGTGMLGVAGTMRKRIFAR